MQVTIMGYAVGWAPINSAKLRLKNASGSKPAEVQRLLQQVCIGYKMAEDALTNHGATCFRCNGQQFWHSLWLKFFNPSTFTYNLPNTTSDDVQLTCNYSYCKSAVTFASVYWRNCSKSVLLKKWKLLEVIRVAQTFFHDSLHTI